MTLCVFAGCPAILRCDYGTENVAMAVVQTAFRLQHHDSLAGAKSFMYGPSTGNIVRMRWLCITSVRYYAVDGAILYRGLKVGCLNFTDTRTSGGLICVK